MVTLPLRDGQQTEGAAAYKVVIEAKDVSRAMGRRKVVSEISKCVNERGADGGILITRDASSLGKELGDWDEGLTSSGAPWIATTAEHAVTVSTRRGMGERGRERGKDGNGRGQSVFFCGCTFCSQPAPTNEVRPMCSCICVHRGSLSLFHALDWIREGDSVPRSAA